jgi:hypothetical protein
MADDTSGGYSIYEKVASDVGGNIAFALIGLGIIWFFAKFWLAAATVLFWAAAVVMALSVAHFLVVFSAGAILWATKRPPARNKWMWAATAARLLEQIVLLIALWLAARAVGYLR